MVRRKATGTGRVRKPATAKRMVRGKEPYKPTYEDVSKTAYYLFEKRNCAHGHDVEDWQEAERILSSNN